MAPAQPADHALTPWQAMALPGQPAPLFRALEQACLSWPGFRLFTIMRHHAAEGWNQRLYSSDPAAYPPGGLKPWRPGPWSEQLLRCGEPFLAQDAAAIRAHFPDHALIFSLGCGSALNLPVRWDGGVIGTVNLLHAAGHYRGIDLDAAMALAAWAAPALLRAKP